MGLYQDYGPSSVTCDIYYAIRVILSLPTLCSIVLDLGEESRANCSILLQTFFSRIDLKEGGRVSAFVLPISVCSSSGELKLSLYLSELIILPQFEQFVCASLR